MAIRPKTAFLVLFVGLSIPSDHLVALDNKAVPGESISIRPFVDVPSIDTSPVSVQAGGYRLVIPRNYLVRAGTYLGKVSLGITTTFPKFGGTTRENFAEFQSKNAFFSPNTILIGRRTDGVPSYAEINKGRIQEAVLGHGKSRADGLIEIDSGRGRILVGLTESNDNAVIICDLPTESPARCVVGVDVAAGLAF